MPIYEYRCRDCGNEFDALRSMKDADLKIACKKCNSVNTARKLSTCFSHSDGKSVAGTSTKSCGGCAGGSCSSCNH